MFFAPSGPVPSMRQKFDSLARCGNCNCEAGPSPQSTVFDGRTRIGDSAPCRVMTNVPAGTNTVPPPAAPQAASAFETATVSSVSSFGVAPWSTMLNVAAESDTLRSVATKKGAS